MFLRAFSFTAALAATASIVPAYASTASPRPVRVVPPSAGVRLILPAKAKTSWVRYGYDVERTNENPAETTVGTGNVGKLHLAWKATLNGASMTQPLVVSNLRVGSRKIDVMYVGDEGGTLWALRASDGSAIWSALLGKQHVGCGQAPGGNFGVTSTPVIDRAQNRIYAVGGDGALHAFDLSSGSAVGSGFPVTITSIPHSEYVWSGLNLNESLHRIYVTTASYCDISPYFGRVIAVDTSSGKIVDTFYVTSPSGPSGGGIWGWGGASLEHRSGDVYVATGNALTQPSNTDYSNQVVKLTPDLSVIATNYPKVTGGDVDLGSTPVLYRATGCPPQLAAESKSGALLVYNRKAIAKGAFQRLQVADTGNDFIGEVAYRAKSATVFVSDTSNSPDGTYKHGMLAFSVGAKCMLSLLWNTEIGQNDDVPSPPMTANGVVYFADGSSNEDVAFDAATGNVLWTSGSTIGGNVYASPSIVNGVLYQTSWDGNLYAFST